MPVHVASVLPSAMALMTALVVICAVVALCDLLTAKWLPAAAYRAALPVARLTVKSAHLRQTDLQNDEPFECERVSRDEFLLRERLLKLVWSYPPVLRFEGKQVGDDVRVLARLNWYPIAILGSVLWATSSMWLVFGILMAGVVIGAMQVVHCTFWLTRRHGVQEAGR